MQTLFHELGIHIDAVTAAWTTFCRSETRKRLGRLNVTFVRNEQRCVTGDVRDDGMAVTGRRAGGPGRG